MTVRVKWLSVCATLALVASPFHAAQAQTDALAEKAANVKAMRASMITQAQREAAAAELKAFKLKIEQAKAAALKAGLSRPASAQLPPGVATPGPGGFPDYFTTSNWAFSPELRKFVDTLPGLTAAGANNLGNYIAVAVPDTISYPGSDYYEISVRQYAHKFHSDLPPTTLRGYVQTNNGTDLTGANTVAPSPISYLGPIIVAQRDRPVRIKFTNELPVGQGGDLFVPVDETIMGSGKGPLWPASAIGTVNPATGLTIDATTPCDPTPTASVPPGNATPGQPCAIYTQNRAAIHLHGGRTPWISDGTPHQWIIPAGEWPNTPYKEGVSLENVPDMPNPGPGSSTYYFSNQQSARLMFYHDHAWGITRLNVLVGMAAGYLIRDHFETDLVTAGTIPADEIPLIIQDRTFVAPDVRSNDPTWNWGTGVPVAGVRPVVEGDLWMPHVYMPAQNPYDPTGVNPYGRWVYGPWFFPPTTNILYNTVANPYHDPACSDPDPAVYAFCTTPGQPPVVPGTPLPSVGMETFFDTAVVNGQAFPSLTVQPKAYRFRVLNAANDRFFNLNLYQADPAQVSRDLRAGTEVKMVPAAATAIDTALYPNWPTDGRPEGVPDPTTSGPSFIQIGTEGGFLPRPVVVPQQPISFVVDPTAFNVGNVKDFGLFLGPAERADVIVDFSQYAGQTLILYNDAPAAVPAFDPRHDFLTGAPDLSSTGGYGRVPGTTGVVPGTPGALPAGPQIGFGPNTRTVMQIKVAAAAPAPAFDLPALEAAFAPDPAVGKLGLFEQAQDPVIVGQDAYNGVYTGVTFPQVWPAWGLSRIEDTTLNFMTVAGTYQTFPMEPKGIHDEMGAAFDMEYGRMSGNLGITNINAGPLLLNFTLYDFTDPSTEILNDAVSAAAATLGDGTQIWKISHNGVDTHPIHFHIFDVQVINRVGWDGQIRLPHPTELGWKDTVRISPLEDTIVAMRPWAPKLPFGVPNSLRPLNPAIPLGSPFGFTNIDPITQQAKVPPDTNRVENLGWEYVWHCHILSHEENDMMRPIVLNVISGIPGSPSPLSVFANALGQPLLSWTDASPVDYLTKVGFGNAANEIAFRVERSGGVGQAFATVGFTLANTTTYVDTTATPGTYYRYRVVAYNEGGASTSNVADFGAAPAATAATGLTVTANPPSPYLRDILGAPTVFTAVATGGTGVYEYRFSLSTDAGATFSVVQAYGAAATWSMPVTTPAGNLVVRTEVRTSATVANDVVVDTPYVLTVPAPATSVLLAAPVLQPSPGFFGTAVTFTAAGQGSLGTFQYRFSLSTNGGAFAMVQDWNVLNTWTLPATTVPGSYVVQVEARTDLASAPAVATAPYVIQYRPATLVTLRSNVATPYTLNLVPTPVSFLATGSGSTGTPSTAYNYRFSFSPDGVTFTEVQPYSTSRTWNMPTTTPAGTYTVMVEVKTNLAAVTADASTTTQFVVVNAAAATGVTLTSSLPSPQAGTAVTFTAAGSGSTGYQYRFLLSTNGGAFAEVQAFSATATWTMAATTPVGQYAVQAEVRASPLAVAAEAVSAAVPMQIIPYAIATSVTLTANQTSPKQPGTNVTFTAAAAGSSNYSYRFLLSTNGGAFAEVQAYGPTASWTLTNPIEAAYVVRVDVISNVLSLTPETTNTMAFVIRANAPATGVIITSDRVSPAPFYIVPVATVFTAAGTGAVGGYDYRFSLSTNGGAFALVQDYGAGSSWTMPASTPIGSYVVQVEVRTSTAVAADAANTTTFQLVAPPPATGVTLTPSVPSPQVVGTLVTFTAQGQGGSSYQYRFWKKAGTTWSVVQDWSTTATWTLPGSTVAGSYPIQVDVRTSTSSARDALRSLTYTIRANAPATGVTLVASIASPAIFGTPVLFTASGLGGTGAYEYRFSLKTGAGPMTVVQNYGVGSAWTMPATTTEGLYTVQVEVRTDPVVTNDAITTMAYAVRLYAPATAVVVTPSVPSPQNAGTVVSFTAVGSGAQGAPPSAYQYRFWMKLNGIWSIVQDYGVGSIWNMPTSTVAGTYSLQVDVRTSTTVARDAMKSMGYTLQ